MRVIPAFAAALVAGAPFIAQAHDAWDCALSAADIFEQIAPDTFEVFSISINAFRVSDRVVGRSGTAFAIGDGYVATNYHVIADALDLALFSDDAQFGADVVGIDPTLDIAVLRPWDRLDGDGPQFRYDPVAIGERVYAVGFPLSLGESLSEGIISGKARVLPFTTSSWLSPFLQTDAAVSQGNSGGPLVDACGRVVGMVSARIELPAAENLGFAIPATALRPILDELIATGKVSRPWHGLYGQIVSPPILIMLGIPESDWEENLGFLVETVEPGSGADKAGLLGGYWPVKWGGMEVILGGDVITEVNGVRIDTLDKALEITRNLKPGDTVKFRYLRDGQSSGSEVVLEERPPISAELDNYRSRK